MGKSKVAVAMRQARMNFFQIEFVDPILRNEFASGHKTSHFYDNDIIG